MTQVAEIAEHVYRISTYASGYDMQFNQFLIVDEQPFLFHTGMKGLFGQTLDAVASIVDPQRLRFVGFSHFESDECGALNEWLGRAPQAVPVCGFVGAMVNVNDFACRPAQALEDNAVLDLGKRRLQFLATPHVPHAWDAGLFFDTDDRILFCSDLMFQPGDPEALVTSDLVGIAADSIRNSRDGPFANDMPYTADTPRTLERLASLSPRILAVMHGSSFEGDGAGALRDLSDETTRLLGRQ